LNNNAVKEEAMTVKAILALADGGAGTDATLKTALLVAQGFQAHLDVLHVRADAETMVPIVGEGMSGAMVEQVMDAMVKSIETRSAAALAAYQRVCQPAAGSLGGGGVVWREVTGREPEVIAAAARLSDLTVLGRPDSAEEAPMAATIDAALFETGRPVLVAPPGAPVSIGKRIAVAWNGSPQSARAISVALPFLKQAEQVIITVGGGEDNHAPASGLVQYLERHGVRATVEGFDVGHGVGKAILEQAGRLGADLLVMGAYGHSRLREMILGGATREVLAGAAMPVLMGH
jgi:nucleotide-binding universal stress UspA family protein